MIRSDDVNQPHLRALDFLAADHDAELVARLHVIVQVRQHALDAVADRRQRLFLAFLHFVQHLRVVDRTSHRLKLILLLLEDVLSELVESHKFDLPVHVSRLKTDNIAVAIAQVMRLILLVITQLRLVPHRLVFGHARHIVLLRFGDLLHSFVVAVDLVIEGTIQSAQSE